MKNAKSSIIKWALLSAITFHFSWSSYAQVTIGSGIAPKKGALLDLKQFEDEDPEKATATMGLSLPRVNIRDKNKLYMGNNLIENSQDGSLYRHHTGLLVYHVGRYDMCDPLSLPQSLYVWDGKEWKNQIKEILPKSVSKHRDQDGNIFWAGQFGKAGTWMLQNLAARNYDSKRDTHDGVTENVRRPMQTNPVHNYWNYTRTAWAYPNTSGSSVNNSDIFNERPELGLLYTWAGATNSKGGVDGLSNVDYPNNPNANEGGMQNQKLRQGICPSGWHLPSDAEWTDLEIEIIQNTPKYADRATPIAAYPSTDGVTYHSIGLRGSLHGQAMRHPCEKASISNRGKSLPVEKNGFAILSAGTIYGGAPLYLGERAYFWTSSADRYWRAWARHMLNSSKRGGKGTAHRSNIMISVRCKKND